MTTMLSNQIDHASVYTDFHGLWKLKSQAAKDQSGALNETAQQFEAMFIQMMLKEMRKSIPKAQMFDSHAMHIYQDMADKQTAIALAKRGKLGIAQLIKQQLQQQGTAVAADKLSQMQALNRPLDVHNLVPDVGFGLATNKHFTVPTSHTTGFTLQQQKTAFDVGN